MTVSSVRSPSAPRTITVKTRGDGAGEAGDVPVGVGEPETADPDGPTVATSDAGSVVTGPPTTHAFVARSNEALRTLTSARSLATSHFPN